jgi:hypothetical protein
MQVFTLQLLFKLYIYVVCTFLYVLHILHLNFNCHILQRKSTCIKKSHLILKKFSFDIYSYSFYKKPVWNLSSHQKRNNLFVHI